MKKALLMLILAVGLFSCTQNSRTREWGGKEEMKLKPNERLINMTWKEDNLWVLTEDTVTKTKYFRESSSWGIWEGEITIK